MLRLILLTVMPLVLCACGSYEYQPNGGSEYQAAYDEWKLKTGGLPLPDIICSDFTDYRDPPKSVLALYYKAPHSGKIVIAESYEVIDASYFRSGLDRVWAWGTAMYHPYAAYRLELEEDGTGRYYDFSTTEIDGTATSSQLYKCVSDFN